MFGQIKTDGDQMTVRDQWAENLRCANCCTSGQAELSQSNGSDYSNGDQAINVERVSDGFKAVQCEYGCSFYCTNCESAAQD
jgi:hypothetical protein